MTRPRLRSELWFGGDDLNGFIHRAWLKAEGHVLQAHEGADFDFLRGGPGQDLEPYLPTSH